MDIVLVIGRTLFRWVWPVVICYIAVSWVNTAAAQVTPMQAHAQCKAKETEVLQNPEMRIGANCYIAEGSASSERGSWAFNYGREGNITQYGYQFFWNEPCPDGGEVSPITGQCGAQCSGGAIAMTNGMCSPKPEECLARNAEPGFANVGETTRNFASHCVGGCQFGVNGPHTQTTHGSRTMVTGTFEFSGGVCGASPSAPPQPDTDVLPAKSQECGPAGASQTFCVKANGDHCATSAAGRQICWKPGETGEKVDGKTLQKRQPGETPTPPRTPPPDGDEWTAPKEAIKTTTESKSSGGTTTNTITTIITNQETKSGVDAGPKNQGEKGDGSGDDKEGEDGAEKGQYSADCAKPPTCSQTDGIGCAMVRQQWSNKCDAIQGDVNQIGNTNELPTDGLESSLIDVWDQGDGYIPGPTDVDTSGWSGRGACPINLEFSAMGKSFNVNHPQLCEILDALAALIMIVGSWHAGFILTTGFRKG